MALSKPGQPGAEGQKEPGPERLKVGVLISGSGTNLQALLDAAQSPGFPAEIKLVIANRPNAYGLERARSAGVPAMVIEHGGFSSREDFDQALDEALRGAGCEFVCLAGFMRRLTPAFVGKWQNRMLNIHPSLLPSFPGLHVHEQVLAAGVRISGCTVHFVSAELDAGPIIAQAAVPVLDGDDAERLAARVLAAEHRIYPLALRLIGERKVRVDGARVIIDSALCEPPQMLLSPGAGDRPG